MLGGSVREQWDSVLGRNKLMGATLDDGPGLILRDIAIIPPSIFYKRHDGGDGLKGDFKQCGSEIARRNTNQWLSCLLGRLHSGLSEGPRIRFNICLRTGGQLIIGLLKGAGFIGGHRTNLSLVLAQASGE